MKKQGSTLFLKGFIIFIGLVVVALCVAALYTAIDEHGLFRPVLVGVSVPAIPFFVALYYGYRLLNYIDKNIAFSGGSVAALKNIKYCAIIICVLYAAGLPYLMYVSRINDAPGFVILGFVFSFGSLIIAVFAAVLQKLIQSGIEIKSENDLTV